jgi:hypothetical protein
MISVHPITEMRGAFTEMRGAFALGAVGRRSIHATAPRLISTRGG